MAQVSCWILAACEHEAVMLPDSLRKKPIKGEQDVCWKGGERKAAGDFMRVTAEAWVDPPDLGVHLRGGVFAWSETPRNLHLSGKHQGHGFHLTCTLTPHQPVSHLPAWLFFRTACDMVSTCTGACTRTNTGAFSLQTLHRRAV